MDAHKWVKAVSVWQQNEDQVLSMRSKLELVMAKVANRRAFR